MNTSAPEHPRATSVSFSDDALVVGLEDGRVIHVPVEWFPRLRDATNIQRSDWRLIGHGIGVHWPLVDEDISVIGLLRPDAMQPGARRSA